MPKPMPMSFGITNVNLNGTQTEQIVHDITKPFNYEDNLDLVLELLHKINRFNGSIPFSVLQHTLLGVEILKRSYNKVPKPLLKAWLLHDMHEIITNDIPSPVKAIIRQFGDALDIVEDKLHNDVLDSFGVTNFPKKEVKEIDLHSYFLEAKYFKKEVEEANVSMEFYGEHIWFLLNSSIEQLKYQFMRELALAGQ